MPKRPAESSTSVSRLSVNGDWFMWPPSAPVARARTVCALPACGRPCSDRLAAEMPAARKIVTAPGAPQAIGPHSHAPRFGELLFCSGQISLDPATGELVGETAAEQARRCLENLSAV